MNKIVSSPQLPALIIFLLLFSTVGYSQGKEPVTKIITLAGDLYPNTTITNDRNEMPNAMKVTPQLTEKLYNNRKGSNMYRLKGGMICIAPDSVTKLKLIVVNPRQKLF